MSFRHSFVLPFAIVTAAACGGAGPRHTDENAFRFETPLATGTTAFVRTMSGGIDVELSPDSILRVTGSLTWRGRSRPPRDVRLTGETVAEGALICARWGNGECTTQNYASNRARPFGIGGGSNASVRFRVQVPSGVKLHLLAINANISAAASAPIHARTVNGNVVVVTAVGPVRAVTTNGNVDARMSTLEGTDSVVVRTTNGNAWAFLGESASATVEVTTTNGRASTDFPGLDDGSARAIRGSIGGGATPIRVRTTNGNASFRRLDAEGRTYTN